MKNQLWILSISDMKKNLDGWGGGWVATKLFLHAKQYMIHRL